MTMNTTVRVKCGKSVDEVLEFDRDLSALSEEERLASIGRALLGEFRQFADQFGLAVLPGFDFDRFVDGAPLDEAVRRSIDLARAAAGGRDDHEAR
jgi:hypothetical protein